MPLKVIPLSNKLLLPRTCQLLLARPESSSVPSPAVIFSTPVKATDVLEDAPSRSALPLLLPVSVQSIRASGLSVVVNASGATKVSFSPLPLKVIINGESKSVRLESKVSVSAPAEPVIVKLTPLLGRACSSTTVGDA